MATVPNPTPATLEEAVALLGALATEKRLLELRIQDLEHRLYGSSSEKLPIEDRQLALIDEVFDHPEPATTEDVVVVPDIEKRVAKKPVRRPLPEHLEVVEERLKPTSAVSLICLYQFVGIVPELPGLGGFSPESRLHRPAIGIAAA